MEKRAYVEFAEDRGNYDNIVATLRIEINELPFAGDKIEIYPEITDRKVIKRRFTYIHGKLDTVRIYI